MAPFSVEVIDRSPAVVLRVSGEARLDVSALDRQVTRLLAQKPAIVVLDLAGLTFCSSLGMGCVVSLRRSLDRVGSKTRLAALQPDVLDSFKRAVILQLFEVFPTVDEAVAAPITPSPAGRK
jgi:anti-sigma B factor antagonist